MVGKLLQRTAPIQVGYLEPFQESFLNAVILCPGLVRSQGKTW
jgi:hypothetical protein